MKILLAVDGSDYTKRMLAYLAAHDEMLGAHNSFTVLTVVPAVSPDVTHFIDHAVLTAHYKEQADKVLRPIGAFVEQNKWRAELRHEVGHAADVIANAAKEVDLVVLGSHGHSALGSLFLGSVASGVLARCKTPTLIVR
jgi:nucleotide-binding universal stress UspA family protein